MKTPTGLALVLSALALVACASAEVRSAADRGRADAEKEIAAGRPCLLYIGLPSGEASPLDRETGLPQHSVGCELDDRTVAYVNAHDGAIRDALRAGRLRGMTFEDRWTTREEVVARFAGAGVTTLSVGDPPAAAPGGRFRVEVAPRNNQGNMQPYLFVLDDAAGTRRELHYLGGTSARVLFAHEGRTLLVHDTTYRWVRTFDLAGLVALQTFPLEGEAR